MENFDELERERINNEESDWYELKPLPLSREMTPSETFPILALGEGLTTVTEKLIEVIQAPPALCGQSVLAAVCLATQGHANVLIDGRRYPLSQNFITIADSGERKSAVERIALEVVRIRQKELREQYEIDLVKFKNQSRAFEAKKTSITSTRNVRSKTPAAIAQELAVLGPDPKPPVAPLLLMEEPTYEGLVKQLDCGQPSVGVFSDEGGRMLGGHGMSAENQLKTVAGLSELWDGKEISRVRAGEEPTILYGKRCSMHLMVQPTVANSLIGNAMVAGQGFLSRCLMCYPESTTGTRTYLEINLQDETAIQEYNTQILKIMRTPYIADPNRANELIPRDLPVSEEAKQIWKNFYNEIESELKPEGRYRQIRALGSKISEHVLRLAGCLTLFRDLTAPSIQPIELECGIQLAKYYLNEALRLQQGAAKGQTITLAEALLAWLQKEEGTTIPLAAVYQYGPQPIRSAAAARATMKILEQHHWVRRINVKGKRSETWEFRK